MGIEKLIGEQLRFGSHIFTVVGILKEAPSGGGGTLMISVATEFTPWASLFGGALIGLSAVLVMLLLVFLWIHRSITQIQDSHQGNGDANPAGQWFRHRADNGR